MLNVIADGMFSRLHAARRRSSTMVQVAQIDLHAVKVAIDQSAGCDRFQLTGFGIDHSDPGHSEFPLLHGDAAGGIKHFPGVLHPNDGFVDIAQNSIDAIEPPDMRFRPHALADFVKDNRDLAQLRIAGAKGPNLEAAV